MSRSYYRSRFAPSPTGLLHAGSLATALASWLDAKTSEGIWLIRMEVLDTLRLQKDADQDLLQQLTQMRMYY
jgi:glutamyl-Q tRNA(Asp) synthetase